MSTKKITEMNEGELEKYIKFLMVQITHLKRFQKKLEVAEEELLTAIPRLLILRNRKK